MPTARTTAALRVIGKFSPDEITRVLGMTPTRVVHPEPASKRDGSWSFTVVVDGAAPLAERIEALLDLFEPKRRELAELNNAGGFTGIFAGIFIQKAIGYVVVQPAPLLARA